MKTVSVVNSVAASKARMLLNMGIALGENTMRAFRKEDSSRVENAARKVSKRYCTEYKLTIEIEKNHCKPFLYI